MKPFPRLPALSHVSSPLGCTGTRKWKPAGDRTTHTHTHIHMSWHFHPALSFLPLSSIWPSTCIRGIPCPLDHCQGRACCFLHSPGNKGVQDSHHLQQNLQLPGDQRPFPQQLLTPLQIALLFYSRSSAAVKKFMVHPGGDYFPMVISIAWCYTNKDHCHLRKLFSGRDKRFAMG